jgi:hypothetical protein
VHADLFDEQAEDFLLRACGREDLVEVVGEAGEGGRVRRRVRPCGECPGEVGFIAAQHFEALTVATRPILRPVRRCVGERSLNQSTVAVQLGELRENGCLEPILGQPLAIALVGAVLVAG